MWLCFTPSKPSVRYVWGPGIPCLRGSMTVPNPWVALRAITVYFRMWKMPCAVYWRVDCWFFEYIEGCWQGHVLLLSLWSRYVYNNKDHCYVLFSSSLLNRIALLRLPTFPDSQGYVCLKTTVFSRVCFQSKMYIQGYKSNQICIFLNFLVLYVGICWHSVALWHPVES